MKKTSLNDIWSRIEIAKNEFLKHKPAFDKYRDYYNGKQVQKLLKDEVVVNYTFAVINTMLSVNFARIPRIKAVAKDARFDSEGTPNRYTAELWIKELWKLIDLENEFNKIFLDGYIYGKGWGKAGYSIIKDLNDNLIYNNPIFEHIPIYDIWVDPRGKHLDLTKDGCAEYVVQRIVRPLLQVQNDPRYMEHVGPRNIKKLEGQVDISKVVSELDVNLERDDIKKVELYEVWIPRENRVVTLCEEWKSDKSLRDMELPFGYMYPFVDFNCYGRPDGEFFGIGVTENMIPQQDEKNRIRTMLMEYIRRNMPRVLALKDAIGDEEDLEQFKTGLIQAIIEVNDIAGIIPWKGASFPAEAFQVGREITTEDVPAITGVSQYGLATLPTVKRQATEAYLAQGGMQGRVDKMAGQIDKYIETVLNKLLLISQEQLIGDRFVSDERGEYISNYPVNRETIEGPIRIEVEGGSSRSLSREMEKQQVLQLAPMLMQLGANPQVLGDTLAKYFDFPNADSLFQGMPMMSEMMGGEGGEMGLEQKKPLPEMEEMIRAKGGYTPKGGAGLLKRVGKFISSKFGGGR